MYQNIKKNKLESGVIIGIFIIVITLIVYFICNALELGTFSIVQVPLIKSVAGNIAIAAFFAPLIVTSPFKGVPPVIINLSKLITSKIIFSNSNLLHEK